MIPGTGTESGIIKFKEDRQQPEVLQLLLHQKNFFSVDVEQPNGGKLNPDPVLLSAAPETEAEGSDIDITKTPIKHSLSDLHYVLFFLLIFAIYTGLVCYFCCYYGPPHLRI